MRSFLLPVHGEKVPEGRMRGSTMRGGNSRKTSRARRLRKVESSAEELMWQELRGRRLNGYKFVRQLPIEPFFADFACREKNLVVEIDGSQHAGSAYDRFRDETMNSNGWSVLRLWHADVLKDCQGALEIVLAALDGRLNQKMISNEMKFLPAIEQDGARP
jgi:very-short-patch-repair endonuclease